MLTAEPGPAKRSRLGLDPMTRRYQTALFLDMYPHFKADYTRLTAAAALSFNQAGMSERGREKRVAAAVQAIDHITSKTEVGTRKATSLTRHGGGTMMMREQRPQEPEEGSALIQPRPPSEPPPAAVGRAFGRSHRRNFRRLVLHIGGEQQEQREPKAEPGQDDEGPTRGERAVQQTGPDRVCWMAFSSLVALTKRRILCLLGDTLLRPAS